MTWSFLLKESCRLRPSARRNRSASAKPQAGSSIDLVRRQRRCPRRRRSLAGADILGPPLFIFLRRQSFQLGGIAAFNPLLKNLFEKRNAPAAAGAGPAAFGKLARHLGPPLPQEVHQLAAGNMKAVTDLGVEVHCHTAA